MDINKFIEKVKELGYSTEQRVLGNDLTEDVVVITEDNYYNVAVPLQLIFDAPFERVMTLVKEEINRLKEND